MKAIKTVPIPKPGLNSNEFIKHPFKVFHVTNTVDCGSNVGIIVIIVQMEFSCRVEQTHLISLHSKFTTLWQ